MGEMKMNGKELSFDSNKKITKEELAQKNGINIEKLEALFAEYDGIKLMNGLSANEARTLVNLFDENSDKQVTEKEISDEKLKEFISKNGGKVDDTTLICSLKGILKAISNTFGAGCDKDTTQDKTVTVEPWGKGNKNDCLSRIIQNSYPGVKLWSEEYYKLEKMIMDANPEIYGDENGNGGRKRTSDGTRHNAVLYTGDKIKLPAWNGKEAAPAQTTPQTDTGKTTSPATSKAPLESKTPTAKQERQEGGNNGPRMISFEEPTAPIRSLTPAISTTPQKNSSIDKYIDLLSSNTSSKTDIANTILKDKNLSLDDLIEIMNTLNTNLLADCGGNTNDFINNINNLLKGLDSTQAIKFLDAYKNNSKDKEYNEFVETIWKELKGDDEKTALKTYYGILNDKIQDSEAMKIRHDDDVIEKSREYLLELNTKNNKVFDKKGKVIKEILDNVNINSPQSKEQALAVLYNCYGDTNGIVDAMWELSESNEKKYYPILEVLFEYAMGKGKPYIAPEVFRA